MSSSLLGKIEISFKKVQQELWSNFGICERTKESIIEERSFSECLVTCRNFFNHDSFELVVRPKKQQIIVPGISHHLKIRANISGTDVERSFTPIPTNFVMSQEAMTIDSILFLIKSYDSGLLSKFLSKNNSELITISTASKGNLDLNKIKNQSNFTILAAGSGVTPMISLIIHLLERSHQRM